MAAPQPQRTGSQTVDRALAVLECFTPAQSSLSLTEFASLTGFAMPTTHRLLKALQARDFVVFDPVSKLYSLGPGAMRLAEVIMQRDDLHARVLPWLERLRNLSGETAALHSVVDSYRVCTVEFESRQRIKMTSGVGGRYPLYGGAAGKAMLAYLSKDAVARVFETADRGTLGVPIGRSREELLAELELVRERGYAESFGEVVEGASALAAPILDGFGRPLAAINITGPNTRFTREAMAPVIAPLLEAVNDIATQSGFAIAGGG